MRSRTNRSQITAAALLAISVVAAGCAESKANQPAGAPGAPAAAAPAAAASVSMPKADRIPMADFKVLLAKGDVVVVDVRSSDAYAGGHIPGALSIPEESITSATAEKLKQMGKAVATYCSWQAEHTSARAAQTLQQMGVPAQAIVGGLTQWVEEKNPVKTGTDAK